MLELLGRKESLTHLSEQEISMQHARRESVAG